MHTLNFDNFIIGYYSNGEFVVAPDAIQFNGKDPKITLDNETFHSYKGLRLYIITGKKEKAFLKPEVNNHYRLDYKLKYNFVPDLHQQLKDTLKLNIQRKPFLKLQLKQLGALTWPNGYTLTQVDETWLDIVKEVVSELK